MGAYRKTGSLPSVPGQFRPVNSQDGSFVGTLGTGPQPGQVSQTNMISFTSSGNLNWSVPGDMPKIATADGGVIAASGITYDSNGNAMGQMASMQTQSWTGNAYTDGPVNQIASSLLNVARSFWALSGANPSASATAAIQETMYLRSFAPWLWFGAELFPIPCSNDCFKGDDRAFSTSLTATARITGILNFWMPGAILGSTQKFSDPSYDIYGRKAVGHPKITATAGANGYALHMEVAGSNPLVPGSPDIDTKVDFTPILNSGQICYSGHLYGDAFPNAEAFAVNSKGQANMLITFTTRYVNWPNFGPFTLFGSGNADMGSFSNECSTK